MEVSNSEFMRIVQSGRSNTDNVLAFIAVISEYNKFSEMVEKINKASQKWSKYVGLDAPKKELDTNLSKKELEWKQFFQDHSFQSIEEQRTLADALSIVEGIDMRRFLVIAKANKARFRPLVCVVPTGNDNGHDYVLGRPIISLSAGDRMYKLNGSYGNSMTGSISCYRIATPVEIAELVGSLLYRSSSMLDILMDLAIVKGNDDDE